MACRLVGAKPLSETMLEYCQMDPLGTNFSEILVGRLRNGGHFASASMC